MNIKKSVLAITLCAAMALGITGCGAAAEAPAGDAGKDTKYTVGICQLAQHPALDAATKGFMDAIEEAMPGEVTFDLQNASNDIPTCGVICTGFAASDVDLILANATPALQAAASATVEIPVLGTAVTEYGVALDIENFGGTVGGNISGTSDLAPLDQQAAMIPELIPDAETVGILYCSAEANSVYQANVVKAELEELGMKVNIYTFADSNDITTVTSTACDECDALYIPTDNTAASCAAAINNVASPAGVPIIAGEAATCKGCGLATFTIDYYDLGRTTGEMAVRVLKGEADIAEMPVEYSKDAKKMYNKDIAAALGITMPEDYEPLE